MMNDLDATVNEISRLADKLRKGIHPEICPHCEAHKENYREVMGCECKEAHPWTQLKGDN